VLKDASRKGGFFIKPTKISFKSYVKIAIAFLVIYAVFLIVSGNSTSRNYINDLILPLTNVLVIIILYFAAQRSKSYDRGSSVAWWIFFVSQILWLMGDFSWALQNFGFGFKTVFSNTLLPYAMYIATFSMGLILLPGPEISTILSFRRGIDIGIIMVILFLSLWTFLVEPIFNLTKSDYGTFLIVFVFLVLEFGLMSSIINVVLENAGQIRNRPISYLLVSALVQVIAASLFAYQIVHGQFVSDTLIDFMWMISILLMGLAGVLQVIQTPPNKMRDCSQQAWYMNLPLNPYIPTICIVIAYLLVLYIDYTNPYFLDEVLLASGIIIFLVISRQILDALDLKWTNKAVKIKELKILDANRKLKNKEKKLGHSLKEKEFLLREVEKEIFRRKEVEKVLKESEVKYRTIFENTGTVTCLFNEKGTILMVNQEFEKISGYSKDELEGKKNWKEFIYKNDLAKMLEYNRLLFTDPQLTTRSYESRLIDRYGKVKHVILYIAMIPGKKKVLASFIDITERKNAEKLVVESLKEKEVLLKEIHHRVKNNMQIISSLLSLQRGCVEGEETINVLRDSQGRVRSMAMIHENIYKSSTLSNINFKKYIKELVNVILNTYGCQGIEIRLEVEDIRLDIDTAIPCGLIINELVTNSVKYAFPHGKGTITIKFKFEETYELIIADNGIGLPHDFDYKKTDTLGLQLVDSLVKQLNGQITLERSQGTEFNIKFIDWD
jgi:two-component system, sensor histidine kinase PdtaS